MVTPHNQLLPDTDDNGVTDDGEDTDKDGLTNSEEVQFLTSCFLADTDGNGIPDSEEQVFQTVVREIDNFRKPEIKSVSVSMECSGYIDNEVTIIDTYDLDMRSSDVVGLVGVPVAISTEVEFEKATITFSYDEASLGDVDEKNLCIMWYDSENDKYILLDEDSVLDTENNTISYVTDHFSTWLVVDKNAWKNCWKSSLTIFEAKGNDEYEYLEFAIDGVVHRYQLFEHRGTWQDAEKICAIAGGHMATIQSKEENAAVYKYLLSQNCRSAYIGLSDAEVEGRWKWSNGEPVNYTNWHANEPGGGRRENYAMYYFMYTDGSWNDGAFNMGGTMLDVSLFICEWDGVNVHTDTDGDGLPDYYELNGMRLSNGRIIKTNPNSKDSDNDGISDYDEMGGETEVVIFREKGKDIQGLIWHMISDPNEKDSDSDGDGIIDARDRNPFVKAQYYRNFSFTSRGIGDDIESVVAFKKEREQARSENYNTGTYSGYDKARIEKKSDTIIKLGMLAMPICPQGAYALLHFMGCTG
ncbi:MAG: hypothetical protein IJ833_06335 [Lachnospiraceae bacterium]|nr:hypothetical protein [Lachnospiraceae bacterium]